MSSVFRGTPAESDGLKGRADDGVSLLATNQRFMGGEVASVPGSRAKGENRKWIGLVCLSMEVSGAQLQVTFSSFSIPVANCC